MANLLDGRAVSGAAAVEQVTKSQRVTLAPRGYAYSLSGVTGTVAAALASGSPVWVIRNDASSSKRVFVERLRLQFTTIVAFTTAITAGRRLHLVRSTVSSANPSGGTALTPIPKDSTDPDSECSNAGGGDSRIATTGALTTTGTTFDTNVIKTITLTHLGAAGAFSEFLIDLSSSECAPVILEPGQCLALVAGALFDAAGTWQLAVNADWHEASLWDSTTSE